jgi:hypothetical protein
MKKLKLLCVVDFTHSFALVIDLFIKSTENGVYSFGYNVYGELGLGNTIDQKIPQLISSLRNEKIKKIVCGGHHTLIWTGNLFLFK